MTIPIERQLILKAWEAGWEAREAFVATKPDPERALPTPREAQESYLARLETMTNHPDVLAAVAKIRAEDAAEPLTITEFLLARIAQDERDAEHELKWGEDNRLAEYAERMLAECKAKRTIVERAELLRVSWQWRYDIVGSHPPIPYPDVTRREKSQAYSTLCDLAAVYSDHPGYSSEWTP